jgi:hypothetical protein
MYPADIGNRLICVMPTSPVKSHPSTDLIDRTIASVRQQVGPDVLLIILADGVRPEQREMLKPYTQYVAELRRKYGRALNPFVMQFYEHKHQVGMLRWLFDKRPHLGPSIPSPHILFVEHDTPFTPDPIDWENVLSVLDGKAFEMIRFLYEGDIHPEHQYMVLGKEILGKDSVNKSVYIRTKQFSARPHVATWDFYKRALEQFSPWANSFVEDKMHSVCSEDPDNWPIGIYYPDPPRGRSFHLDGRAGEEKFEGNQVF